MKNESEIIRPEDGKRSNRTLIISFYKEQGTLLEKGTDIVCNYIVKFVDEDKGEYDKHYNYDHLQLKYNRFEGKEEYVKYDNFRLEYNKFEPEPEATLRNYLFHSSPLDLDYKTLYKCPQTGEEYTLRQINKEAMKESEEVR